MTPLTPEMQTRTQSNTNHTFYFMFELDFPIFSSNVIQDDIAIFDHTFKAQWLFKPLDAKTEQLIKTKLNEIYIHR